MAIKQPGDLPKADRGRGIVSISGKTWNLLVDVIRSGWPISGHDRVEVDQVATGRTIRFRAEEGEEESSSSSSSSSGSSSPESSSGSSSSGSSSSSSGSSSSDSSSEDSSEDESSESESSKDCVAAYRGGWIRWHCVERGDVKFEECMTVAVEGGVGRAAIPPEFLECCEADVRVIASSALGEPMAVGAEVVAGEVVVRTWPAGRGRVSVWLDGTRKGFAGRKWERATAEEAAANAAAWRQMNGETEVI